MAEQNPEQTHLPKTEGAQTEEAKEVLRSAKTLETALLKPGEDPSAASPRLAAEARAAADREIALARSTLEKAHKAAA